MRIRTQFILSMVLFGLALAVIASSVILTSQEVARLDEREDVAEGIGGAASELGYLANEFVLHREPQLRVRWRERWTSLSGDAGSLEPATTEERVVTETLSGDVDRLQAVFEDVDRSRAATTPPELIGVLSSRLAVQSQAVVFDALRLAHLLRERKIEVQRRNALLVFAFLAVFAAYFALMYIIVYRRALTSLVAVRQGAAIIGQGNLDHTIPVQRNDEVGDLTRAFNSMATDLKRVTASKAQLEEEVAEREAAQEALHEAVEAEIEAQALAQRELETTRLLLDAAEALASRTELRDVAQQLAEIMVTMTGHTRAVVDTFDSRRQEIVVAGSAGKMPFTVGSRWALSDVSAATRTAISERRMVLIEPDSLTSDERGIAVDRYKIRRMLCVPLVQREMVVGLVMLDDPGEEREFTKREIELVEGIAAQAAVAIENARLYDIEHDIADRLQEALLAMPMEVDGIEFAHEYHAATEAARVGGDFYDLIELGDARIGVVMGDVAGKGLDAAVLTSLIKNAIRAYAHESGRSPSEVLRLTNETVYKSTPVEAFATVFLGVLDCRSGRMTYANAGHNTPALLREEGALTLLPPTGPLLGALSAIAFEEADAQLSQNDVLFLYTDGLTEARGDGQWYGDERLFCLLQSSEGRLPGEIVDRVVSDVTEFAGSELRDDLAIMAIRLTAACQ